MVAGRDRHDVRRQRFRVQTQFLRADRDTTQPRFVGTRRPRQAIEAEGNTDFYALS